MHNTFHYGQFIIPTQWSIHNNFLQVFCNGLRGSLNLTLAVTLSCSLSKPQISSLFCLKKALKGLLSLDLEHSNYVAIA